MTHLKVSFSLLFITARNIFGEITDQNMSTVIDSNVNFYTLQNPTRLISTPSDKSVKTMLAQSN